MSQYHKTTFWERWLFGFIINLPLTCLCSCMVGFELMGQWKTGLLVWAAEAAILGLGLATCPTAEVFRKHWSDRSDD